MNNHSGKNTNKAPSLILSGGVASSIYLEEPDRFGKYSMVYVVGVGNKSFLMFQKMCGVLAEKNGIALDKLKLPVVDMHDGMFGIRVGNKKKPPILAPDKTIDTQYRIKDGEFVSINISLYYYAIDDTVVYMQPDGNRGTTVENKRGITSYLNGVLVKEKLEEVLF